MHVRHCIRSTLVRQNPFNRWLVILEAFRRQSLTNYGYLVMHGGPNAHFAPSYV